MISVIRIGSALRRHRALNAPNATAVRSRNDHRTIDAFAADNAVPPPINQYRRGAAAGTVRDRARFSFLASSGNMVYRRRSTRTRSAAHWADQSVNPSFNPAFNVGMPMRLRRRRHSIVLTSLNALTMDRPSSIRCRPPGIPRFWSGDDASVWATFRLPAAAVRQRQRCRILPMTPSTWTAVLLGIGDRVRERPLPACGSHASIEHDQQFSSSDGPSSLATLRNHRSRASARACMDALRPAPSTSSAARRRDAHGHEAQ